MMPGKILYLEAHDRLGATTPIPKGPKPEWVWVEECVRLVFEFGGDVKLTAATIEPDERISMGTFLGMPANPGECLLIYSPAKLPGERSQLREWWEPGDAPFRGTTSVLFEHQSDDRMVCRDVSVAIELFRDFFDHGDLSKVGLSQTRSGWDPKPH